MWKKKFARNTIRKQISVTLRHMKHLKMYDHVTFFNLTQLITQNAQGFSSFTS